jgi:pimeloyl-ACP methyl ester carboxylesterase
VVTTEASKDKGRPPVVLVHGAWHASWSWTEHWAGYLAENGYTSHALDLRGHGDSPGPLAGSSITDYVEDLEAVVGDLDEEPVIVGHSMGGFVTQHFMMRNRARGAVLVASVPIHGAAPATVRVAKKHTAAFVRSNLTLHLGHIMKDHDRAKDLLFSPDTPHEHSHKHVQRTQNESYVAFLGMLFKRPKPHLVKDRVMVIGAEHDGLFRPDEVRSTATAYGTDATIIDATGHNMMLDTRWEEPAEHVVDFLDTL